MSSSSECPSAIVSRDVGLKTVVAVVVGVGDSKSSHRMTGCLASHCGQVICQLLCCYLRRVCQTRSHCWQRHCCTLARHSGPKKPLPASSHTSCLTNTTSWLFGIIIGQSLQAAASMPEDARQRRRRRTDRQGAGRRHSQRASGEISALYLCRT